MKRSRDSFEEEKSNLGKGNDGESEDFSLGLDAGKEKDSESTPNKKARRPMNPKVNALRRLEERCKTWGDQPEFAKNLVANMFRLSRLTRQAAHAALPEEDGIEFSKDIHEPILSYLTESVESMLEGAKGIQMLRDRQRMSAEDLRVTVARDSRFQPFRTDELLASMGETAPALVAVIGSLHVGKGTSKTNRVLYEHLLEEEEEEQ